jgi:urea transporter
LIRTLQYLSDLFRASLNSYGVTAFVTHPIPSMLVFLATWFHPVVGAMGLLGTLVSNMTARWLGMDRETWRTGVYGLSGLLVGLAVGMYTEPGIRSLITMVAGAAAVGVLSAFLQAWLSRHDLPILSFPMILMIWPILISLGVIKVSGGNFPTISWLQNLDAWLFNVLPLSLFEFVKAFGTILFQDNLISGLIVLIAIGLWSRISLAYALWGGAVGMAVYYFLHGSLDGFNGLNFVLTALAFGGYFIVANRNAFLLTTLALLTVGLVDYAAVYFLNPPFALTQASAPSAIFGHETVKIPSLVFAFNVVTLVFLFPLKVSTQSSMKKPRLIPVPLSQIRTPEANVIWAKRWLSHRYIQKTLLTFPFLGEWMVLQGHDGEWTHKGTGRHAWDFVICDDTGKQHRDAGTSVEEYYCFGLPVLAPAPGIIVAIENNVDDNEPGSAVTERNWGNYVILDHGNGEFSEISHFRKGTIKAVPGQSVKRGDVLGHCGNSGRSPVPHIHLQLQESAKPGGKSLPTVFSEGVVNNEIRVNVNPEKDDRLAPLKISADAEWGLLGRETELWKFQVRSGVQRFTEILHFTTDIFGLPAISTRNNYLWYILDKPSFVEIVPDFKTIPSVLAPSGWMKVVGDSLLLPKKLHVGLKWESGEVLECEGNIWTIESNGRVLKVDTERKIIQSISIRDANITIDLISTSFEG